MGERRGREHPWRAPLYPVCAHSSPSGCGCKPDRQGLFLRAKLDAVFFHLYGVTGRDDVRYVYSTFPVVEREETAAHGAYRSRELCLAWMNAPAAGDPDAEIAV